MGNDDSPRRESDDQPAKNPSTIAAINARLAQGSERMDRFEKALEETRGEVKLARDEVAANTALTRKDHDMTAEIREIVVLGRKFFFYIGKLGGAIAISVSWGRKAVLWAGPPIAILATAYHTAGDSIKAFFHWGSP